MIHILIYFLNFYIIYFTIHVSECFRKTSCRRTHILSGTILEPVPIQHNISINCINRQILQHNNTVINCSYKWITWNVKNMNKIKVKNGKYNLVPRSWSCWRPHSLYRFMLGINYLVIFLSPQQISKLNSMVFSPIKLLMEIWRN